MTSRRTAFTTLAAALLLPLMAGSAGAQAKKECTPVKAGSPAAKDGQKCKPKGKIVGEGRTK